MHLRNPSIIHQLRLTRFSAVGDGMHIELAGENGADPFVTFREDEQLGLQAVVHLIDRDVVFPLAELKRAIAIAEDEVHTESFYDGQPPSA
jgi:hypothetical protein